MSSSLPDGRRLVTNLLNAVSSNLSREDYSNPLSNPSPIAKNLLLTLHVLFPTELLPALDLLDRKLVTRLVPRDEPPVGSEQDDQDSDAGIPAGRVTETTLKPTMPAVYIIRSAQPASTSYSRFRDATALQYYEVRTRAWNCSCPAFAFSAFPAIDSQQEQEQNLESTDLIEVHVKEAAVLSDHSPEEESAKSPAQDWNFGGVSVGKSLPLCKHLLACVLVERVEAFARCVESQYVSDAEMAGWLAR